MFTKTVIALSAALVLATAYASVAIAQTAPRKQWIQPQPYSKFEKLWFSMATGEEG
jgi:hypothetical protein